MDTGELRDHVEARVLPIRPNLDRALKKFRPINIEIHLNRAADLLDRCLAGRTQLKALEAQDTQRKYQLKMSDAREALDEKRIESGYFKSASDKAAERKRVLDSNVGRYSAVDTALRTIYTHAGSDSLAQWHALAEQDKHAISRSFFLSDLEAAVVEERLQREEYERTQSLVSLASEVRDDFSADMVRGDDHAGVNFQIQAMQIRLRIARDYKEACDYMLSAMTGLKAVFGQTLSEPGPVVAASTLWEIVENLDVSVNWVRTAIQWLNGFSLIDQAATVVIPLKKLLSQDDWHSIQVCNGQQVFFDIDLHSHFKGLSWVRFRGLSASYVSSEPAGYPLSLQVTLPADAGYFDQERSSYIRIDQRTFPSCMLGSVWDLKIPRTPELWGAVSLMNASPIGFGSAAGAKWSIASMPAQGTQLLRTDIQDIYLEIRVVGQQPSRNYMSASEVRDV
jgi:hypothetical protein